MSYPILITRAQKKAHLFRKQLIGAGIDPAVIHISPVVDIHFTQNHVPLDGDLVLTSGNGILGVPNIAGRRAYCVGRTTTDLAAHYGADAIYCGATARDLLSFLRRKPPRPLIYARGAQIAVDICTPLRAAGHRVEDVIVYRQAQKTLNDKAMTLLQNKTPVIVPFFSAISAMYFMDQTPDMSHYTVACISESVSALCCEKGGALVHVAKEPNAQAMIDCVLKCQIDLAGEL